MNYKSPLYFLMEYNNNQIYIKREDLLPFSFGGNKLRICDCFFEDMQAQGANHIIGYGPPTSNLCRVLANRAKSLHTPCTIVCASNTEPEPCNNAKMVAWFGANIVYCNKQNVAQTIERVHQNIVAQGQKPYYIYGDFTGQGNESAAARAYATAYVEIAEQIKEMGIQIDSIYHASATGMTQGGLLAGKYLHGGKEKIVGISVARTKEQALPHIAKYANSLAKVLLEEICFLDQYRLQYGQYNQEIANTIGDVLAKHGIALDSTYTGKAFWGMLCELQKVQNKKILFIHTGGSPLFFDNLQEVLK